MRLIGEATLACDIAQRHIGREHELLRTLDSSPDEEFVRRSAKAVAERDVEMEFAEIHQGREFTVPQRRREAGFDVFQHAASLPGGQPWTGNCGARNFRLRRRLQEVFRAPQIQHRVGAVVTQRLIQRPGNIRDG